MGCGLLGGSGQNALRPAASAYHRGAGRVYLLHSPLPFPTPHLTGRGTCPGASEVLSSHLGSPITPLVTLGHAHLITPRQSPPITTQDCLCIGIPPQEVEEALLFPDSPIRLHLFTNKNSPQPIRSVCQFTDRPITLLRTASISQGGSPGDQPIRGRRGEWEAEAGGRSPAARTVCQ